MLTSSGSVKVSKNKSRSGDVELDERLLGDALSMWVIASSIEGDVSLAVTLSLNMSVVSAAMASAYARS